MAITRLTCVFLYVLIANGPSQVYYSPYVDVHYIEGEYPSFSNWLRYVNGARCALFTLETVTLFSRRD